MHELQRLVPELVQRIAVLEREVSALRGRSFARVNAARQRQAHRLRAAIRAAVASMKANPPHTERYRFGEPVVSRSVREYLQRQGFKPLPSERTVRRHMYTAWPYSTWPVGNTPAHPINSPVRAGACAREAASTCWKCRQAVRGEGIAPRQFLHTVGGARRGRSKRHVWPIPQPEKRG
jgi:hypothetical protein